MSGNDSSGWAALEAHRDRIASLTLRDLFADPQRFERFSPEAAGLFLDYSKNRLTEETRALLVRMAGDSGLEARRAAMFAGEKINTTEHRPAMHVALRNRFDRPMPVDGVDAMPAVRATLDRIGDFVARLRSGAWRGHGGAAIADVVQIGIGGSDFGPRFVCQALSGHSRTNFSGAVPRVHFVANLDAHELDAVLAGLSPATTLFIVASKTFSTLETMTNARSARAWCLAGGVPQAELHRHFAAVSTNQRAVEEFGIDPQNMFPIWDWVGGRYSLWSAIGVGIALQCGMDAFLDLLAGAHAMDRHFESAPLEANMPVLLALVGVWNANLLGARTISVSPYPHLLQLLPNHLQQLEMESSGKSVTLAGEPLPRPATPVLLGAGRYQRTARVFSVAAPGIRVGAGRFHRGDRAGSDAFGRSSRIPSRASRQLLRAGRGADAR